MYFDSHAHYDDHRFDDDRDELLQRLPQEGVDFVVNSASDMESSLTGIDLAEKYDYIFAAVGVHPHEVKNMKKEDLETLKNLTEHKKVVAIGEIGLDFYYDLSERDIQRFWFKEQLKLAKDLDIPVIIHSREAAQETFDIIKESGVTKGVIHCYSGSTEMALEYTKIGFYIGIGGVITFGNAKKLVEVAEKISLEKILIETDCPYLAPNPNRGKRNDSTNLKYVVKKLSEIKNIEENVIANVTNCNTKKLFFK